MADLELRTLDLRSSLGYAGLENPALAEARLGQDMADGEEELFLFDEEELVAFDPERGPELRRPLPRPRFYGRRSERPTAELAPGSYAFLQWRPRDEDELIDGLEWFAREVWWEGAAAKGPYILRRVREDGRLATQALRRIG